MLQVLVESQFNWIGGALHWGASDLHQLNVLQLHVCRSAFGLRRTANESWVEWNQRTLRFVRVSLHQQQVPRWSARALTLQHMLHGHWARRTEVVRGCAVVCPTLEALRWRSLSWWREQQDLSPTVGARHPARFYASNTERQLAETHGNLWIVIAQDRQRWTRERQNYVFEWDVRWTSGRQLAIRY